jgi:hypothetical protein
MLRAAWDLLPSPAGVLGAAWPQPPGGLLTTWPPTNRARLRYRARCENSVFFGFTSDFSKLRFLETAQGEISIQKIKDANHSIGGCAIDCLPITAWEGF